MGIMINAQDRFGKLEARGVQAVGAVAVKVEKEPVKSGGVEAAKAIRKDLKAAYPAVKFSVTSDYTSVNVRWIDGPATKDVDILLGKYEMGHFDGMIDCYDFSNRRDDIPQMQYLFTNRDYSFDFATDLATKYTERYGHKIVVSWKENRGHKWMSTEWAEDVPFEWSHRMSAICALFEFESNKE